MIKTALEHTTELGLRIKHRRLALGWTQLETAKRAGVTYGTWRRLEASGSASIETLVRAAMALRCEQFLDTLFPLPQASSLDALLKQQQRSAVRLPKRGRSQ